MKGPNFQQIFFLKNVEFGPELALTLFILALLQNPECVLGKMWESST